MKSVRGFDLGSSESEGCEIDDQENQLCNEEEDSDINESLVNDTFMELTQYTS